jgi:hypothetical protein
MIQKKTKYDNQMSTKRWYLHRNTNLQRIGTIVTFMSQIFTWLVKAPKQFLLSHRARCEQLANMYVVDKKAPKVPWLTYTKIGVDTIEVLFMAWELFLPKGIQCRLYLVHKIADYDSSIFLNPNKATAQKLNQKVVHRDKYFTLVQMINVAR